MVAGGTSTFQNENICISELQLPLAEPDRPKTSVSNRPLSVCRIISNENEYRHITISTQTDNKNDQQSLSSKRSISTQTIVEDIRQPAFPESYQSPVINETIVKRPHTHKEQREKKKVTEIEQIVIDDSPPIVNVSSSIRDPFDPEFFLQWQH